jgi:tetrahydrodipicolinate N-succinyltransferase
MSNKQLEQAIESAWDVRDQISPATTGATREAIEDTLNSLDSGQLRVAEKRENGDWYVNQWAKKAVLWGFALRIWEFKTADRKALAGGIKLIVSSKVGVITNGVKLVFELFQIVLCANRPLLRQVLF